MSRRRVVLFTESIAASSGGTALEVVTIASALAHNTDHEVTLLTCADVGPHLPVGEGVQLIHLGRKRLGPGWWRDVAWMREILGRNDVLFVTGIWGPFDGLGLRLALPPEITHYVRICGMLQPYILNRNPWKKALARLLYVNHNLSRADGLIVNSDLEKDQVASLGFRAPIHLIRNGVTPPREAPKRREARSSLGLSMEDRVMLYLGRIHPKKGLQKLLPALREFAVRYPDQSWPKLLVAGGFLDEAFETLIRKQIALLPETGMVTLLGEVAGEGKEVLFAAADVFILPSESEGLPNAALESMVRSLPVILTPGCNLPEVADEGAGLVVELDANGLARALAWTMGPEAELRNSGHAASLFAAARFGMDRVVDDYDRLIVHKR
jgi:glycosyltransferase involved in cell wall biosynthesis